jgi:hypothetical protein
MLLSDFNIPRRSNIKVNTEKVADKNKQNVNKNKQLLINETQMMRKQFIQTRPRVKDPTSNYLVSQLTLYPI